MNRIATIAAALAIAGGSAMTIIGPVQSESAPSEIAMSPGKATMLDVGRKHTISYFEPQQGACRLTVLIASAKGGSTAEDSPGTRVTAPIAPGQKLVIDEQDNKSAAFTCGPDGTQMSAKLFIRPDKNAASAQPPQ